MAAIVIKKDVTNDKNQPDYFLNLKIEDKEGKQHSIGKSGIGLFKNRRVDAFLINLIEEGEDINKILSKLVLSCNENTAKTGNEPLEFDLE